MPFLYPATELQLLLLPVVSLRTEENNLDNNAEIIFTRQHLPQASSLKIPVDLGMNE